MKPERSNLARAFVLACAMLLVACGGGGSGGGFLLPEGGTSGTGVSNGTTVTGISAGQVTSFGSILVNGRTYLTSADDPAIDTTFVGPAAGFSEADLAVAMLVQVLWDQTAADAPRRARRVAYLPELIGAVTGSFDPGNASLEVAGRTVRLASTTVFDDVVGRASAGTATLTDPAQLTVGSDRLEVSGFLAVTDPDTGASEIEATRLARIGVESDPGVAVTGVVSNPTAGAFELRDSSGRTLTVSFDAGTVTDSSLFEDSASTRLIEEETVRISGELSGDSIVAVSRIERPLADLSVMVPGLPAQVSGEIAGKITRRLRDDNRFRIAGQRIAIDANTTFLGSSTPADLEVGRRATATGTLMPGGSDELLASEVFVERAADVELEDVVATAPTAANAAGERTFEVRIGLTVVITPNSILKDDTDISDDGRLDVDTIVPGDFVEVQGFFDAQGRLVAVKLERDDDDDECEFEGPVAGSEVIDGRRHYTIANRPGFVIVDIEDDSADEKIRPGAIGEFESDEPGNCALRPTGFDINGHPIDAGFFADDVSD